MNDLFGQSSASGDVRVCVRSEVGALRTVAMRWANPLRLTLDMATSVLSASVRAQLRHNAWGYYRFARVREQQQRLVEILRSHGVTVLLLDNTPGACSQHYTRDIAFCVDDAFFVARMGTRYRESEQNALEPLLQRLSRVERLQRGRIEGGDVMLSGDKVLVGLGEATDMEGVDELRCRLSKLGNPREVVPIPFACRGVIHLDTKFNIVGSNLALFARKCFQPSTIRWFEKEFELIEVTDGECLNLAVNALAIGGGKVVLRAESERLAAMLQQRRLTPIPVDYSEVTRWPGAFRCTTLPIERDS